MASLLEPLRPKYDYIIIDCGLKHELLTVNALAASDGPLEHVERLAVDLTHAGLDALAQLGPGLVHGDLG